MMKKIITSSKAPIAVGPYSQAVLHESGYILELSGQIGVDPMTGKLVDGGITAQTEQTLANIRAVLSEIGWDFEHIIKVRIYLVDITDYSIVNSIYIKKFGNEFPARVALAVKQLPLGALVEIECSAGGESIS